MIWFVSFKIILLQISQKLHVKDEEILHSNNLVYINKRDKSNYKNTVHTCKMIAIINYNTL